MDALVRQFDGWIRRVAYATIGNASIAEDVAQSVWATAWQQIGGLQDAGRWRGWLYRLTRNAAIDSARRQMRERQVDAQQAIDGPSVRTRQPADPVRRFVASEEQDRVLRAIQALPSHYREPFVLRHLQEWSYAEISDAMGIPVDTVETRLVRARRLLRESLADLAVERRISVTR